MLKDDINAQLLAVLNTMKATPEPLTVGVIERTSDAKFGNFTTNIAMRYAKKQGKNPLEFAQEIADQLAPNQHIAKVEAVAPGFINIWATDEALLDAVFDTPYQENVKVESFKFQVLGLKQETILFEYGQPNTHKMPHIGHLFSYIYGESVCRILESVGNKIIRVNYQGDIGLHVAKCLWAYQKEPMDESKPLADRVKYLQLCYQNGSAAFDEDEVAKQEIYDINNKIYAQDESIIPVWQQTRDWCLEFYSEFEKSLGIKQERHFLEHEVFDKGKELVQQNVPDIFEESQGAIVFPGEKYGLHTRVFITARGVPTYEGKEVGLAYLKNKEFAFDKAVITTASEQNEYYRVATCAIEKVIPDLMGKIQHVGFGMINLKSGKMSSRTGAIVDAISLLDIVTEQITKEFENCPPHLARKIAIASIKYSFLKSDAKGNMSFDIESSIGREGDSAPYALYTVVRCKSILKEVMSGDNHNFRHPGGRQDPGGYTTILTDVELNSQERELVTCLGTLQEVVRNAAHSYAPHHIASLIFKIAGAFGSFYQACPILKAEGEKRNLRIFLTQKTLETLERCFYLLGIETVEKM